VEGLVQRVEVVEEGVEEMQVYEQSGSAARMS
jgi:hypothetical protein